MTNAFFLWWTGCATVTFKVQYKTAYGQRLRLVGSDPALGSWSIDRALPMQWGVGDLWVANVALPVG